MLDKRRKVPKSAHSAALERLSAALKPAVKQRDDHTADFFLR